MKSFQAEDAFHLQKIFSYFEVFKNYHIEVFQKEYKKIIYASSNTKWHKDYVEKQGWLADPMVMMADQYKNVEGVYLFEWPLTLFQSREKLQLYCGFAKLKIGEHFLQIINVCVYNSDIDNVEHIFDALEFILGGELDSTARRGVENSYIEKIPA